MTMTIDSYRQKINHIKEISQLLIDQLPKLDGIYSEFGFVYNPDKHWKYKRPVCLKCDEWFDLNAILPIIRPKNGIPKCSICSYLINKTYDNWGYEEDFKFFLEEGLPKNNWDKFRLVRLFSKIGAADNLVCQLSKVLFPNFPIELII